MAKSPAERKAAQRARRAPSGVRKLEIVLDAQEIEMLERNCATRRPGRAPYEFGEYIALLIRQDDARVLGRIKSISRKCSVSAAREFQLIHVRVMVTCNAG